MDDRDRAEMRALCDQFSELMAREVDQQLFDNEARVRIGEIDWQYYPTGRVGIRVSATAD